jgi:hypothetical protein
MQNLYGVDLFGDIIKPNVSGIVAQKFGIPPFTILDAKQGDWQERKRAWAAIGIAGEIGRSDNLLGMSSTLSAEVWAGAEKTSIFDPVICELAYNWWSPKAGQIVDPFAGGSVRGIVAKALGRKYLGCDLRAEQIAANIEQAEAIFDGYEGHSGEIDGLRNDL